MKWKRRGCPREPFWWEIGFWLMLKQSQWIQIQLNSPYCVGQRNSQRQNGQTTIQQSNRQMRRGALLLFICVFFVLLFLMVSSGRSPGLHHFADNANRCANTFGNTTPNSVFLVFLIANKLVLLKEKQCFVNIIVPRWPLPSREPRHSEFGLFYCHINWHHDVCDDELNKFPPWCSRS